MMMRTEVGGLTWSGVDSGVYFFFFLDPFLYFCMNQRAAFLNHVMVYTVQRYGTAGGVHLADQVGYERTPGYITPYDIVLFAVGWEGRGLWVLVRLVWYGREWDDLGCMCTQYSCSADYIAVFMKLTMFMMVLWTAAFCVL
jgi:hypothetical protein